MIIWDIRRNKMVEKNRKYYKLNDFDDIMEQDFSEPTTFERSYRRGYRAGYSSGMDDCRSYGWSRCAKFFDKILREWSFFKDKKTLESGGNMVMPPSFLTYRTKISKMSEE